MAGRGIRLSIVVASLRCGGVERSVATTAAALSRRGHRVTVVTYDDTRNDFFSLPPEVERIPLGLTSARPTPLPQLIRKTFWTLSTLRAGVLASAPQVVIAHMAKANVQTLLALAGSHIPIIVTEHGDVATDEFRKAAWYRLRRACYRSAFRVVSVSEAVDRNVRWLPDERRAVIANPIVVSARATDPRPAARNSIVSVGRLSHAKGFDILISAFGRLAADFPEWRLIIVGGGELRAALEHQAADLRLGERVLFTGALADPTVILRRAKLFVMGSRYEGFPLAHAEALACGLPVVATDCPSRPLAKGERFAPGGVREIVQHDVNGLLVAPQDPDALARGMAALMSDPCRREALSRRGPEVLSRLSPEKIADAWEKLIDQAIPRSKPSADDARRVTPDRVGARPRRVKRRAVS
jgi:GalNAc-alpha-(1->4)-GalNAc-alpha-(1->3)-diNAcBac-PP-undecaprenol alpha-1,4-N-acetyl-D-galactosaminyltransferase